MNEQKIATATKSFPVSQQDPALNIFAGQPANEPTYLPRQGGTFLDAYDLAELTGIRGGNKGHTRAERQVAALVAMKVPHYVNAAGLPVVSRAVVEGGRAPAAAAASAWQPRLGK